MIKWIIGIGAAIAAAVGAVVVFLKKKSNHTFSMAVAYCAAALFGAAPHN